jgi:uncharacterized membrane protein YcaP (DUF421 family)
MQMDQPLFFDTWSAIGRTVLVGALAYGALVVMLRVSGKRTLSKMNAFDLIVTIALGSTLATILLDRSVPLAEGLAAFTLLIGLQYCITWMSVRHPRFQNLIKADSTTLVEKGVPASEALLAQRVTLEEAEAAVRQAGHRGIDADISVFLETDGSLSVIKQTRVAEPGRQQR